MASDNTSTPAQPAQPTGEPVFLAQDTNGTVNGTVDNGYDPNVLRLGVIPYPQGLFELQGSNDDFSASMRLGAMGQFRGYLGYFEPFGGGDEEFNNAFEVSRLQVYGNGELGARNIRYHVQGNFADGDFMLQDAWGVWRANENWGIRAGQFKNPLTREGLVWSGHQLATERSLIQGFLNEGRVQGVSFMHSPGDRMRTEFAIHDGFSSENTSFLGSDTHIGISGRFEMLMRGLWRDYTDFTAADTDEDLLAFGVAAGMSWEKSDDRTGLLTADLQYENTNGVGAFGAIYVNQLWLDGEDFFNVGATVQVSFMTGDNFEPFVRLSLVQFDDEILVDEDTFFELSPGFNWYLLEGRHRHRLKLTTDLNFLPNGSPFDVSQLGYQATDEFEVVLRSQIQLAL